MKSNPIVCKQMDYYHRVSSWMSVHLASCVLWHVKLLADKKTPIHVLWMFCPLNPAVTVWKSLGASNELLGNQLFSSAAKALHFRHFSGATVTFQLHLYLWRRDITRAKMCCLHTICVHPVVNLGNLLLNNASFTVPTHPQQTEYSVTNLGKMKGRINLELAT